MISVLKCTQFTYSNQLTTERHFESQGKSFNLGKPIPHGRTETNTDQYLNSSCLTQTILNKIFLAMKK